MKAFKLSDQKIKHPFQVPDGYFGQLETTILDKARFSSLGLDASPKQTFFDTPDLYFETLNQNILDAAFSAENLIQKQKTRNNLWLGIAAAILVVVISIPLLLIEGQSVTDKSILADVSNEEILYYLDFYDVEELDLMETVDGSMEWIGEETDLPSELLLDETSLEDLYLEYGISEIM